ncbi:cob(I)yrinic acid a,c-diamide adenosyltransferase [Bacillus sp. FJAT-47783]|uniref:cob(I)yrinic acid a,c-diamide adenosyltransferase n=1 Tax=Bacillus sp. FJAT-47783 TaxID=2922712 RepID=UPI001FAC79D2|nr:cob(I)yrinic acid a,c-diamide adenosyltransferase [Bacillus sp. FJAT-47783]
MNIYTKTGDKGQTSIIGGRVDKDDLRVQAYGTIDELNAFIGLAMTKLTSEPFRDIYNELEKIQHELFDCGGDLAVVYEKQKNPFKTTEEMVQFLEQRIDEYVKEAPPLERFILPGGTEAASTIHIARTIARRAERMIVSLQKVEKIHEPVLKYMNRLSDYLFALARVINNRSGKKDIEYERSAIVFRSKKQ